MVCLFTISFSVAYTYAQMHMRCDVSICIYTNICVYIEARIRSGIVKFNCIHQKNINFLKNSTLSTQMLNMAPRSMLLHCKYMLCMNFYIHFFILIFMVFMVFTVFYVFFFCFLFCLLLILNASRQHLKICTFVSVCVCFWFVSTCLWRILLVYAVYCSFVFCHFSWVLGFSLLTSCN